MEQLVFEMGYDKGFKDAKKEAKEEFRIAVDKMIAEIEVEIEKNKMNALEYYGLSHALRIINKYCKGDTDG